MGYKKRGYRKNHKRKPRERQMRGLQVDVYDNNVDKALRIFKKKVKESGLMLDLKKKQYYIKKSTLMREKKNLQRLRYKYKNEKNT